MAAMVRCLRFWRQLLWVHHSGALSQLREDCWPALSPLLRLRSRRGYPVRSPLVVGCCSGCSDAALRRGSPARHGTQTASSNSDSTLVVHGKRSTFFDLGDHSLDPDFGGANLWYSDSHIGTARCLHFGNRPSGRRRTHGPGVHHEEPASGSYEKKSRAS